MPLSRLENFLINTDGNILYVNPSDLDATDAFDNKGNSLTRPFVTIQRALLEAARFSYQSGPNNDRYDKTTILLYPGTHYIDNRPGYYVDDNSGTARYQTIDSSGNSVLISGNVKITASSNFDLNSASNELYRFNSVDGGVIIPKGTSLVGMDLRKTKVKPLYIPDPEDPNVEKSALFRVTGGCYFWQFSIFDGDRAVFYNKNYSQKTSPKFSHHKLTCFEYADGINVKDLTGLTDLSMYYYKLMNAYGDDTGNRDIAPDYPLSTDFEPNSPEFKIVGDLTEDELGIVKVTSSATIATVETNKSHKLSVDDSIRITGISSGWYNGPKSVSGITSATKFTYLLPGNPNETSITPAISDNARAIIDADNVSGSSPYIFNCSLRSVYGMCGLHADGSKATGFKSMVVAQFTGIGLQKDDNAFLIYNSTTDSYNDQTQAANAELPLYQNQEAIYKPSYESAHIRASNSAFIQAVSTFAIGFTRHFVAQDGSDQSITNSNSNFGAKSLVSAGFRNKAFGRDDSGYVTHLVPPKDLQEKTQNVVWKTLDVGITTSVGISSHLYLLGETDEANPPSNIVNGYRVGSKIDEVLYLNVNIAGVNKTFSSPITMEVPVGTGDGPIAQKEFTVNSIDASQNVDTLTLTENHNFLNGESVRVYSDTGLIPDGLDNEGLYYVITTGTANVIKLAKTFNAADEGKQVTINNTNGVPLTLISRVTDKIPGDKGHPIQWDSTNNNWYILGADQGSTISTGLGVDANTIKAYNSQTYVQRKSENRDLKDRLYKVRYVVPKEYEGARTAKAPAVNYVLQESSTVNIDDHGTTLQTGLNLPALIRNRNPRTIAGITTAGFTATVTTELPHKLSIGDKVLVDKVLSTGNPLGVGNSGYNGYFEVNGIPTPKTFTYSITKGAGTFSNTINTRDVNLPTFSRNEYDTSYTIHDVDTVQEYVAGSQDGIYYLTCLIGNVSPTKAPFTDKKFKQDVIKLYPTVDVDNPNTDPEQSISIASNKIIGKVDLNDSLNSITKEGIIEYLKDNRVGFAVSTVISDTTLPVTGVCTITSQYNHNLNAITGVTIGAAGTGYNNETAGTVFNAKLINETSGLFGEGGTVKITTNAAGAITAAEVLDGGSAYGIGNTHRVEGGNGGHIQISAINSNDGDVIQIVGVGTTGNRTNSGYNGLWEITNITAANAVQFTVTDNKNANVNPGIYTDSAGSGTFMVVENSLTLTSGNTVGFGTTSNLAGIVTVTTTSQHGLSVGNKVKISGVTGFAATIYNSDFVVQQVPSLTTFKIDSPLGITSSTAAFSSAKVYKYGLTSLGQDSSFETEKISGSLLPMGEYWKTLLNGAVSITATGDSINMDTTVGLKMGDFLQINNEIFRVKQVKSATQIDSFRGVLGSKKEAHADNVVVRRIKVIPSEVRRFSSIRASGHTFEYLGYGPGNYSTSLPQKHSRTITKEEELLAISTEEKGGVVFFSGMNDRGDFFSGERVQPQERFLGEVGNDGTAIFDDVYIRNTLRVGGGPNRNLPSEFRGPVNFTNKITSTAAEGIEAIKLLLKGNPTQNPSFQVGPDNDPALIVNETSQNVGIHTINPHADIELDVNGTIRANVYENFKLTDLPIGITEEVTYKRNRVLKVKDDGTGYELVDPHDLDIYALRSLNVSNDPTVYVGISSVVNSKLQISGIGTSRFNVGEKIKVFGLDPTSGTTAVPNPSGTVVRNGISATSKDYHYWIAQYEIKTGMMGNLVNVTNGGGITGLANVTVDNMNDLDHMTLTFSRTSSSYGILVYRQEFTSGGAGLRDIEQGKLIAILGNKELGTTNTGINWKDYGNYNKTPWSPKGTVNEFIGVSTQHIDGDQIHFPNIGTEGKRRGWVMESVVAVGNSNIQLSANYLNNISAVGFGTTSLVRIVHDNTHALRNAIEDNVARGGNYLELPSGTYYANELIVPSGFTLTGSGKNTVVKQQFFALDETDGGGNTINSQADGNFVGIGTTNPRDVTIENLTIDGNSLNNIRFEEPATSFSSKNYLVNLGEEPTSFLIKGIEIRNSPAGGLYVRNSKRLSLENSSIVDGGLTDEYAYQPLDAQGSTSLRINDSLFENFPGPVDVSVTSVVGVGGNIIRACGTGLRTYATGKITTSDNIILGPSDEWIPSPDIHDSDWSSVNVTVDNTAQFTTPLYLYLEEGVGKDLSAVTLSGSGIGTMLNVGGGSTEIIGPLDSTAIAAGRAVLFDGPTNASATDGFSPAEGYLRFELPTTKTSVLSSTGPDAYGYRIWGTEFMERPVGYSTFVGIGTGKWEADGSNPGTAKTYYTVHLKDISQYNGIGEGAVVKLVDHDVSPDLKQYQFFVGRKYVQTGDRKLELWPLDANGNLGNPFSLTPSNEGGTQSGYISIRNIFTIAKGRVGVI